MSGAHSLQAAYAGRRVFVTGHTGFKGSWLSLWLARLGAHVTGYALPPCTTPSVFELARVGEALTRHVTGDVRDQVALTTAMREAAPEVIFHLAAQPLVRLSYREPAATWSTNVMGTVNLLEAARACPSVKAIVVITTDKCYDNREWIWGYRESDPLGGSDPYSASKAATELVVQSYRKSFFSNSGPLLASARAGNVIGGGDWSDDRLIPDAARAVASRQPLLIRNPAATRPWQHVLESLHGYLLLGARLSGGEAAMADAFNFGPDAADNLSVADVLTRLQAHWPALNWQLEENAEQAPHEARFLYLDSSKARRLLDWTPTWQLATGLEKTAQWYYTVAQQPSAARAITEQQLDQFCS
ncbi:CDP-glucose 4,6-dehydratase [Noviherbaspirillum cavernae]|uniref:CDP-glucose 4,6-dehydratase n=1 Tax=Noviherbaspirillum cavernae TaxID=2320862 RepID=A0A418X660_9BURK|nr:CDP-glucose 4,6-dehydratase [Noviherbaspirillum cavernae]RJG07920.1 CDP-glucose 4,6-dehydratase [Noviherbaspirillum cavernae]